MTSSQEKKVKKKKKKKFGSYMKGFKKKAQKHIDQATLEAKQFAVEKIENAEISEEEPEVTAALERLKETKNEMYQLSDIVRNLYEARVNEATYVFKLAQRLSKVSNAAENDAFGPYVQDMGQSLTKVETVSSTHLQKMKEELLDPLEQFRDVDVENVQKLKLEYKTAKADYDLAEHRLTRTKEGRDRPDPKRMKVATEKRDAAYAELTALRNQLKSQMHELEQNKQMGLLGNFRLYRESYAGFASAQANILNVTAIDRPTYAPKAAEQYNNNNNNTAKDVAVEVEVEVAVADDAGGVKEAVVVDAHTEHMVLVQDFLQNMAVDNGWRRLDLERDDGIMERLLADVLRKMTVPADPTATATATATATETMMTIAVDDWIPPQSMAVAVAAVDSNPFPEEDDELELEDLDSDAKQNQWGTDGDVLQKMAVAAGLVIVPKAAALGPRVAPDGSLIADTTLVGKDAKLTLRWLKENIEEFRVQVQVPGRSVVFLGIENLSADADYNPFPDEEYNPFPEEDDEVEDLDLDSDSKQNRKRLHHLLGIDQ